MSRFYTLSPILADFKINLLDSSKIINIYTAGEFCENKITEKIHSQAHWNFLELQHYSEGFLYKVDQRWLSLFRL